MFRLLGFLIGSIAALAVILVVLGVPEFHLSDSAADQARFDAAVKKLKNKRQALTETTEEPAATPDAAAAPSGDMDDTSETTPEPDIDTVDSQPSSVAAETRWYSFWNPFRTEIAARGFVTQLEKTTGLDYRVVKIKTGVYEVAFAYGSDTERRTKLSQISAATGLDLPDS